MGNRSNRRNIRHHDRLLNGLVIGVLVVLGLVAAVKWRDSFTGADIPTEVKGIQVTRPTRPPVSSTTSSSTTTTTVTTAPPTDPHLALALFLAVARANADHATRPRSTGHGTTTTTSALPPGFFLTFPTGPTTTTTRPPPTTTTTSTTSTTTSTTTTTTVPVGPPPIG